MGLNERTAHELLAMMRRGETTPQALIEDLYAAIEAREPRLGAYLALVPKEELLRQAEALPDGPLALKGLPVAVKDLISTRGLKTTCGSQILRDFEPIYDATAVRRLKEAGALILGKTNLDEFGMGSSNENSSFYPARNPHDPERVPGGSSGGSAAAVAAHTAIAALGTDTGGSIRLPAAFCGVVGLKPTYGLVSRYGLVAYASSLDQIGPITKDVRDAALLLNVLAGHDPKDSTSLPISDPDPDPNPDDPGGADLVDYTADLGRGIEGYRIGVPREYVEDLKGEAAHRIEDWKRAFQALGAQVVEVSLPHAPYAIPTYYLIACSEASANLARFDGVRYTSRASEASLYEMFAETRDRDFGPEVKRRIMLGTYALSAGYYDQFYGKAQKARALIKQDFERAFQEVDVLLAPTSPTPAFRLGERVDDPITMYLSDIYTVSINLAGVPAISIPGGTVDGLPFGMQLIGDKLQEAKILRAAYAYEQSVES